MAHPLTVIGKLKIIKRLRIVLEGQICMCLGYPVSRPVTVTGYQSIFMCLGYPVSRPVTVTGYQSICMCSGYPVFRHGTVTRYQ